MHKTTKIEKFTPYCIFLFFFNLFSNLRKEKKKNTKKKKFCNTLECFLTTSSSLIAHVFFGDRVR